MSVIVRSATPTDVPWLLEQLRAFDRFFGSRRSLFPDEAYARTQLRQLIDVGPFFVAESDSYEERVGFIAGIVSPHFLNPQIRTLAELFWWVAEPYRGSSAGARLLEAFVAWGREHADWIIFTLEARSPVNPATLERRGFRLYERNYLLEVA